MLSSLAFSSSAGAAPGAGGAGAEKRRFAAADSSLQLHDAHFYAADESVESALAGDDMPFMEVTPLLRSAAVLARVALLCAVLVSLVLLALSLYVLRQPTLTFTVIGLAVFAAGALVLAVSCMGTLGLQAFIAANTPMYSAGAGAGAGAGLINADASGTRGAARVISGASVGRVLSGSSGNSTGDAAALGLSTRLSALVASDTDTSTGTSNNTDRGALHNVPAPATSTSTITTTSGGAYSDPTPALEQLSAFTALAEPLAAALLVFSLLFLCCQAELATYIHVRWRQLALRESGWSVLPSSASYPRVSLLLFGVGVLTLAPALLLALASVLFRMHFTPVQPDPIARALARAIPAASAGALALSLALYVGAHPSEFAFERWERALLTAAALGVFASAVAAAVRVITVSAGVRGANETHIARVGVDPSTSTSTTTSTGATASKVVPATVPTHLLPLSPLSQRVGAGSKVLSALTAAVLLFLSIALLTRTAGLEARMLQDSKVAVGVAHAALAPTALLAFEGETGAVAAGAAADAGAGAGAGVVVERGGLAVDASAAGIIPAEHVAVMPPVPHPTEAAPVPAPAAAVETSAAAADAPRVPAPPAEAPESAEDAAGQPLVLDGERLDIGIDVADLLRAVSLVEVAASAGAGAGVVAADGSFGPFSSLAAALHEWRSLDEPARAHAIASLQHTSTSTSTSTSNTDSERLALLARVAHVFSRAVLLTRVNMLVAGAMVAVAAVVSALLAASLARMDAALRARPAKR